MRNEAGFPAPFLALLLCLAVGVLRLGLRAANVCGYGLIDVVGGDEVEGCLDLAASGAEAGDELVDDCLLGLLLLGRGRRPKPPPVVPLALPAGLEGGEELLALGRRRRVDLVDLALADLGAVGPEEAAEGVLVDPCGLGELRSLDDLGGSYLNPLPFIRLYPY